MKFEFSQQKFEKKLKYQTSSKSVQWEPSLSMRTERRTDETSSIVAFHNFAKAPKNGRRHLSAGSRRAAFIEGLTLNIEKQLKFWAGTRRPILFLKKLPELKIRNKH